MFVVGFPRGTLLNGGRMAPFIDSWCSDPVNQNHGRRKQIATETQTWRRRNTERSVLGT